MTMPTADKLRYAIQALDPAIEHVRICLNPDSRPKDRARLPEFIGEYQRLVPLVAALQEARQAESNIILAVCKPFLPKPFCQPVGIRGEAYFKRGWAAFMVPVITNTETAMSRAA